MNISDDELYKLVSELGIVSEEELVRTKKFAGDEGIPVYDAFLRRDLLSDEQMGRLVADFLRRPFVLLNPADIDKNVFEIIPEEVARKHMVVAFSGDSKRIRLATSNPEDIENFELIGRKAGLPVEVYFATPNNIGNIQALYKGDLLENLRKVIGALDEEPAAGGEVPVVKIVDTILNYGYESRASDIHIDPQEESVIVRFRVDGVLRDVASLPKRIEQQIITRIKILARLRTDEHQLAQDGKIHFSLEDGRDLDVRVSIAPTTRGEAIAMRLLSEYSRSFSLADLGLREEDIQKIKAGYSKPYGMMLATGPTGSGKTTTMYAVLKLLNRREVNIMTIEDPVEYDLSGVNQIQVNPKTNLTFASGLKSILRQDPNVILVGEIRDPDTAGIAINAAMTGHIVLSTLHTNDAATAIPRLMEMGVEPFLVASTLNIIIAQRLLRTICRQCVASVEIDMGKFKADFPDKTLTTHFGRKKIVRTYAGKGCSNCLGSGYEGRIGIYEVMIIDEELRKAISGKKDASEIREIAIRSGMATMVDDGLEKVKRGITTMEEVLRVIKEQ